jgi:myosin heavy chain 6/7
LFEAERNYHIFYQMCSLAIPGIDSKSLYCSFFITQSNSSTFFFLEICLIQSDPTKYQFVSQGMTTIDGVDDAEEMRITDEAFDVLGFTAVCIN